ncbi:UNVERIFIED_CONTAM: putative arabinosyltransferase A [Sesamum calycinum]|uniref:Arabinosyltransferase A n=1 Tax=Sesamum calycinum TaxID=2727403 RepID=A0AAW2PNZ0_9LAMI
MSSVSEKSLLPSRLLSCLIAFSMFLLISASLSLVQLSHTSLIPKSVLQLIIADNSKINLEPDGKGYAQRSPLFKIGTSEKGKIAIQEGTSEGLDPKRVIDEPKIYRRESCDERRALLRVYMYDLPPEFHFGLLGWTGDENKTWPSVNARSRIPSYPVRPCSAVRVKNSSEADVIFVPFFSSLSYNRHSKIQGKENISINRMLQEKLVEFLKGRKEWKQTGGRNHLIVAHHPNSMLIAREKLGAAMFVLADFGRYPIEIANIKKDVIAPYKHMVRAIPAANSAPFDERPTLVYFQGAIYRKDAGRGMASSKFCLNIAGDTPSSNRLFDAIASHCVPVIISDEIELPFEDVLDYSEFCLFIRSSDAMKKGYVLNLLRGIKQEKWMKMWERLKEISRHFEYQYPSQPGDAVDMIWQTVSRKKTTRLNVHRKNRYSRSQFL